MIEITVLDGEFQRIREPTIHHRDAEMIGLRLVGVKRCPVFARDSLVDKYGTRKHFSINGY